MEKKDAVFIVGSAYAGFIKEYSGRTAAMNFCCYATANSASEFQERFFKDVVQPDSYYYGPLSALIEEMRVASQLCVFDLCRASLVKRGPALVGANGPIRNDSSKEAKGNVQLAIFNAYVAANAVWTGRRFTESAANRIIALGNLAAAQVRSTLVNLLDPGNRTEQDRYGNQLPPRTTTLATALTMPLGCKSQEPSKARKGIGGCFQSCTLLGTTSPTLSMHERVSFSKCFSPANGTQRCREI